MTDEMMASLMEYLKDAAKEENESKQLASAESKLEMNRRAKKLDDELKKIGQLMAEASVKAHSAMDAAAINLRVGMIEGLAAYWGAFRVQLQDVQTMVRGLPARIPIDAATAARPGLQQTIDHLAHLKAVIAKARKRVESERKKK